MGYIGVCNPQWSLLASTMCCVGVCKGLYCGLYGRHYIAFWFGVYSGLQSGIYSEVVWIVHLSPLYNQSRELTAQSVL
eukprot:9697846-Lingulodinium_polyedra.AAC.1